MRNRYLKSIVILLFLLSMFAVGTYCQVLLEKEWRFVDLTPANLAADGARSINILPYIGGRNNDILEIPTGSPALNSINSENWNKDQFTILMWLELNFAPGDGATHQLISNNVGGGNGISAFIFTDGTLYFDVTDKDALLHRFSSSITGWSAGDWHQVVLRLDFKNDEGELYVDGASVDSTPTNAFSDDSIDAIESDTDIGHAAGALQLNGATTLLIESRSWTNQQILDNWNGGDGLPFVVSPDTLALLNTREELTSITYHPGQLKINSISTVTLTLSEAADTKLIAGEEVAVYDDDNPPNIVYTAVASVSGSTVVVDDSCAAVSGTNKTITRNLTVDGDMEIGNAGAYAAGGAGVISKSSVEIFKDAQSLKVLNGDGTQEWARQIIATVTGADYRFFGRFFAPDTPNGASQLVDVDLTAALGVTVTQADLSAGWNDVEFAFEAADTSTTIDLGSGSVTNAEFGYWDDVRVEANLIANGGMEGVYAGSGTIILPPGWSNSNMVSGQDAVGEETTIVHSGAKSVLLTLQNANTRITQSVSVVTGEYYTLSVWAYNGTSGRAALAAFNSNFATNYTGSLFTTNSSWTLLQTTFKAVDSTLVIFLQGFAAGTCYFDDVVLERNDTAAASTADKGDGLIPLGHPFNPAEWQ